MNGKFVGKNDGNDVGFNVGGVNVGSSVGLFDINGQVVGTNTLIGLCDGL